PGRPTVPTGTWSKRSRRRSRALTDWGERCRSSTGRWSSCRRRRCWTKCYGSPQRRFVRSRSRRIRQRLGVRGYARRRCWGTAPRYSRACVGRCRPEAVWRWCVAGSRRTAAGDRRAARGAWRRERQVLVAGTALQGGLRGQVPARSGVALVCRGQPPDGCWRSAFTAGVERVLTLPEDEQSLMALLAEVVDGPPAGDGRVLGVVGGRGGAGAAVFAAAVAVESARRGEDALLVDCDALGGGIDLLRGAEHDGGLRWPDVSVRGGRVSMQSLRSALPRLTCGGGSL